MKMKFMPVYTAGTSRDRAYQINKGIRTDSLKYCSPFAMAETTSSSSSNGGWGECNITGNSTFMLNYHITNHSPTMTSEEEEEDMANCLIMLAHSVSPVKDDHKSDLHCQKTEKLRSRRLTEMAATVTGGKSGFHIYECKTCNRSFPSFQALGGHRASHKKPKLTVDDRNSASVKTEFSDADPPEVLVVCEENKIITNNNKSPSPDDPLPDFVESGNNRKVKVHECSVCGSEFFSGQALGGHMRRHRTASSSSNRICVSTNMNHQSVDRIIEKSPVLSLDLNLLAPEIVDDVSDFQFTASSSPQHLVFSARALVDCHY